MLSHHQDVGLLLGKDINICTVKGDNQHGGKLTTK